MDKEHDNVLTGVFSRSSAMPSYYAETASAGSGVATIDVGGAPDEALVRRALMAPGLCLIASAGGGGKTVMARALMRARSSYVERGAVAHPFDIERSLLQPGNSEAGLPLWNVVPERTEIRGYAVTLLLRLAPSLITHAVGSWAISRSVDDTQQKSMVAGVERFADAYLAMMDAAKARGNERTRQLVEQFTKLNDAALGNSKAMRDRRDVARALGGALSTYVTEHVLEARLEGSLKAVDELRHDELVTAIYEAFSAFTAVCGGAFHVRNEMAGPEIGTVFQLAERHADTRMAVTVNGADFPEYMDFDLYRLTLGCAYLSPTRLMAVDDGIIVGLETGGTLTGGLEKSVLKTLQRLSDLSWRSGAHIIAETRDDFSVKDAQGTAGFGATDLNPAQQRFLGVSRSALYIQSRTGSDGDQAKLTVRFRSSDVAGGLPSFMKSVSSISLRSLVGGDHIAQIIAMHEASDGPVVNSVAQDEMTAQYLWKQGESDV